MRANMNKSTNKIQIENNNNEHVYDISHMLI